MESLFEVVFYGRKMIWLCIGCQYLLPSNEAYLWCKDLMGGWLYRCEVNVLMVPHLC